MANQAAGPKTFTTKSIITEPPFDDLAIWRYMDFSKYVALLEYRSVFFTRLELLGDPFEAAFPASQSVMDRILALLPPGEVPPGSTVSFHGSVDRAWESTRKWMYCSCWHAGGHESAGMWRLYAQSSEAIAIKSTVERLRGLAENPGKPTPGFLSPRKIHIGMVDYIDFETDRIPPDFLSRAFRKRKSFEHEKEVRAVFMELPKDFEHNKTPDHAGRGVLVDPAALITEIVIAPQGMAWFARLVEDVSRRYGLDVPIVQSALDAVPSY
jgi:hypothetical protein